MSESKAPGFGKIMTCADNWAGVAARSETTFPHEWLERGKLIICVFLALVGIKSAKLNSGQERQDPLTAVNPYAIGVVSTCKQQFTLNLENK